MVRKLDKLEKLLKNQRIKPILDPASGCYVQSGEWEPGKDVSCKMENEACLPVECSGTNSGVHC